MLSKNRVRSAAETLDFEITGTAKLEGSIPTNASKNGALGLFCAALLNRGTTILHRIPRIQEIFRLSEIFESMGVKIKWIDKNSVQINPPKKFKLAKIPQESASLIRSVLMIIGPLAHFEKKFIIPHSGGCKMGHRTIAAHRFALEKLGINIETKEDHYTIESPRLSPNEIVMYEASDTASENAIMAAALIPGMTTIKFLPPNYQVQEVSFFLEKCGVKMEGIGTSTLTVYGVREINKDLEYYNSEDPAESMMFITAAILTKSKLIVTRCPIDFLSLELLKLEKMGLKYKLSPVYLSKNEHTRLVDITIFPSKLIALNEKIHAQPYPGINSDNLPFFVPIATQAEGTTMIHDWMWENRAVYFTELNRLGANITLADPHRVFIQGPSDLKANQVVCPPALRPAMIIMVTMIGATGTSILRNVYSINRGYENISERLNKIGAKIKILNE